MAKDTTVISVASGKGGVGKSNFALNLSLALAELGKATALFDADLSLGNASLLIGSNPQKTILNLVEDDLSINDIIYRSIKYDNFMLIPAGTGITKFADLSKDDKIKISNKIDQFKTNIDYLIIDTAAGASDEVSHFINLSDILILVIIPEITSIKDAYGLLKILKDKGIVKKPYLVINKARSKTQVINIFEKFEETVKKFLEIDIELLGPIPQNPKISEAVNNQTPIIYYEPEGSTASLFRQYAHFMEKIKPKGKNISEFLTDLMMLENIDDDIKDTNFTKSSESKIDITCFINIEKSISSVMNEVNNIDKVIKLNLRKNVLRNETNEYFNEFQVGKDLIFVERDSYFVSGKILGWDYGNYIFIKNNSNIMTLLEDHNNLTARYSFQDKLVEFKTRLLHKPSEFDEIILFMYPKKYTEFSLRGNKRYPVHLTTIIIINNEVYKGKIIDLNLSGALIISEIPLQIGDSLRLSFVLPDGKLIENIFCKVKNIRDATKYGLMFESISPLSYKRLKDFFEIYDKITGGKESITEVKKTNGNLQDIGVMDLVQVLSISNKNCVMEIVGVSKYGKIYFEKGAVVHAVCDEKENLEAFYELMEIEKGEFIITEIPESQLSKKTINISTNKLLLDAAFIIDTKKNRLESS
ncbi:MAG: P-loop NTPase [Deferribacterales bacterium]